MLINLSNHISSSWPENQISAANQKFGEVFDMQFPKIEASDDEEQILKYARDTIKKVETKKPEAVFCVGEFSFCYAVLTKLIDLGYDVFLSKADICTNKWIENGISKRNILYKFIEFEKYNNYLYLNTSKPKEKNDILLNCSWNYQSDTFDKLEIEKSKKFANKIIDLPIEPILNKNAKERESTIINNINLINEISPKAIILDGEFFTWYAMSSLLKSLGYTVICKCSNRKIKETKNPDGTLSKISNYKFIRYRKLKNM